MFKKQTFEMKNIKRYLFIVKGSCIKYPTIFDRYVYNRHDLILPKTMMLFMDDPKNIFRLIELKQSRMNTSFRNIVFPKETKKSTFIRWRPFWPFLGGKLLYLRANREFKSDSVFILLLTAAVKMHFDCHLSKKIPPMCTSWKGVCFKGQMCSLNSSF